METLTKVPVVLPIPVTGTIRRTIIDAWRQALHELRVARRATRPVQAIPPISPATTSSSIRKEAQQRRDTVVRPVRRELVKLIVLPGGTGSAKVPLPTSLKRQIALRALTGRLK